jgi:TetR/AcrR family transcriptional regulator, cholesterol catabolism regulator
MEDLIRKIKDTYLRYGIKSVTMDDLAHELGVSKKTLYEHYKDKEDVVRKVVVFMIQDQQGCINTIIDNPEINAIDELLQMSHFIADHLKSVNPSFSYDLKKYYSRVWDELVEFKSKTVFEHIMANIRKGIDEGLYRSDLNYEIIAYVYVARMELYSPGGLPELQNYSYQEVFRTLFQYHVRGIANENGRQYLEKLLSSNEFENLK